MGRCTSRFSGCIIGGTTVEWYVEELDIVFDDSANWNFSTSSPGFTEIDFESVAVHELGHGHQMGHVIEPSAIMHYSISNGDEKRTLNANDIAGAGDVQSRSTSTTACSQTVMSSFDCATLTNDDFAISEDEFSVYPNPVSDFLNVKLTNDNILKSYYLFDVNGKTIIKKNNLSGFKVNINVNQLSTGVYFLRIDSEKGNVLKKIVVE